MTQAIRASALPAPARSPWLWVLCGGVLIATLDLIFACSFWGLRHDVAPMRILQSIAAGVLGKDSFGGGSAAAWLGAALHYAMATVMVAVYYLASLRLPALVRHPIRYGLPYGVVVYAVMTYVVIPLSAVPDSGDSPFYAAWVYSSIAFHALVVGLLSALFSKRAQRGR
jgi:hypothetical protein